MLKLLFVMMYEAALRVSEVAQTPKAKHTIHLKHLSLKKNHFLLRFPSFKHKSKPDTTLKLMANSSPTCPMRLLKRYLQMRGSKEGPLFLWKNGMPLTRKYIFKMISAALKFAGRNSSHYNTHSFRIGKASDMANEGASPIKIALVGRWHSSAYKNYTKPKFIAVN